MNERQITAQLMRDYESYLLREEKSIATIEKYIRDVGNFCTFSEGRKITKDMIISYKEHLLREDYAVSSINSMLASINSFLSFAGMGECKVKSIRRQKQIYSSEEKELTKEEYFRLLHASAGRPQLNLILKSICSTGIRVSELKYFTVESVKCGEVTVNCKGKVRSILIPSKLRSLLLEYAAKNKISSGCIFVGKNQKPLNRTYIWSMMKSLCLKAGVDAGKVFPHNLRKLFAKTFYSLEKDIAKLADILGHSSINTTRIYIMTTGTEHRRKIEKLGLLT